MGAPQFRPRKQYMRGLEAGRGWASVRHSRKVRVPGGREGEARRQTDITKEGSPNYESLASH